MKKDLVSHSNFVRLKSHYYPYFVDVVTNVANFIIIKSFLQYGHMQFQKNA